MSSKGGSRSGAEIDSVSASVSVFVRTLLASSSAFFFSANPCLASPIRVFMPFMAAFASDLRWRFFADLVKAGGELSEISFEGSVSIPVTSSDSVAEALSSSSFSASSSSSSDSATCAFPFLDSNDSITGPASSIELPSPTASSSDDSATTSSFASSNSASSKSFDGSAATEVVASASSSSGSSGLLPPRARLVMPQSPPKGLLFFGAIVVFFPECPL